MKYDYKDASTVSVSTLPLTRGYQQELLEESLKRNIIIALDTGAGKTHIAVLRMKMEVLEREPTKLSWFIAPTVALVEQQKEVISTYIPVSVGMVSGASEPDQWKDSMLWRRIIETHRIMVTTPQVLLDALRHGYISLGGDISLVVFDEVHHAGKNHPYNAIMKEFYFHLPARNSETATPNSVRPMIMGLTASPIFGGSVADAFRTIEQNLDAVIRSTRLNREELTQFVHRPIFKHVQYDLPPYFYQDAGKFPFHCRLPSHNFMSLQAAVNQLKIDDDPYVKSLRKLLTKLPPGLQRSQADQKLSKVLAKNDTLTHRGLRDFLTSACAICTDVGPWAADWYVQKVLEQAQAAHRPFQLVVRHWDNSEKRYLLEALAKVNIVPVSYDPAVIFQLVTPRFMALADTIMNEKLDFESNEEMFSGIVFVTRRDVCIALTEVLRHHPFTCEIFQVGCLLGTSQDSRRTGFLDISRSLVVQPQAEILGDFKVGAKNLIISTSVAEEGIDVQACCTVVRWDPPQNMISWAQSRGRARRKRSSFVIMSVLGDTPSVLKWEELERQMVALYNDASRLQQQQSDDTDDDEDGEKYIEFRIPETGATLTLNSSIGHLNHFCAVLPSAGYGNCLPIYEIDPPDFPEDWHSQVGPALYRSNPLNQQGPYGATVHLPRHLPQELRKFTTERTHATKAGARKFVAFQAYKALYEFSEERFLNEHLLPFSRVDSEQQALVESTIEKRSGMSAVTEQMNTWAPEGQPWEWWAFELSTPNLPSLVMLAQRNLPELSVEELPVLYIPGPGAVTTSVKALGKADTLGISIENARLFTRRLFWRVPGSKTKLKWENSEYRCLFYPRVNSPDPVWDPRWLWVTDGGTAAPDDSRVNAEAFGKEFNHPEDIYFVRASRKHEDFRFLQWKFDEVTGKEEERLRRRYLRRGEPEIEITYPLLLVKPIGRKDFLVPFPVGSSLKRSDAYENETELLLAKNTTVQVSSPENARHVRLLPSILRHLSNAYTINSFRKTLISSTPLAELPFELLLTALSTPAAGRHTNYERLETLGDTVLKFVTSIQVMADHPFWHEGYLSLKKDHAVANVTLAKAALAKGLYRWIIRDQFVPSKWSPQVAAVEVVEPSEDAIVEDMKEGKVKEVKKQNLSTKVLADVVEALIGASYIHGKFELGTECIKLFGMGIEWTPLSVSVEKILEKIEPLGTDLPLQLIKYVEKMLDYEFTEKTLVVEALTHPSYNMNIRARPYDRLEFLGDAVLDMIVSDYLYRAPGKDYAPGQMFLRKVTIVNLHFLAFACLNCSLTLDASMPGLAENGEIQMGAEKNKIYLWQCLFHSNARVMDDMTLTYTRYKRVGSRIEKELKEGSIYPWAALTSLQAPKFFSDIVESLLGAIFLDSHGDLDVIRKTLRILGIMPTLERIVAEDIDVLHPVSRLAQWASVSKPQKEIKYKFKQERGKIFCTILMRDKEQKDVPESKKQDVIMDDAESKMEEVVKVEAEYHGLPSKEEVRFAAAERAVQLLHLRDGET